LMDLFLITEREGKALEDEHQSICPRKSGCLQSNTRRRRPRTSSIQEHHCLLEAQPLVQVLQCNHGIRRSYCRDWRQVYILKTNVRRVVPSSDRDHFRQLKHAIIMIMVSPSRKCCLGKRRICGRKENSCCRRLNERQCREGTRRVVEITAFQIRLAQ
jgi:hypothetical protein